MSKLDEIEADLAAKSITHPHLGWNGYFWLCRRLRLAEAVVEAAEEIRNDEFIGALELRDAVDAYRKEEVKPCE